MNNIGWISSLLLVLCGVPELYRGISTGHIGASWGLVTLWLLGEILGVIYTFNKRDLPLFFNYSLNTIIVGAIFIIKFGELL